MWLAVQAKRNPHRCRMSASYCYTENKLSISANYQKYVEQQKTCRKIVKNHVQIKHIDKYACNFFMPSHHGISYIYVIPNRRKFEKMTNWIKHGQSYNYSSTSSNITNNAMGKQTIQQNTRITLSYYSQTHQAANKGNSQHMHTLLGV